MPISSALFNSSFRNGITSLDVPVEVKLIAVQDITNIHKNVPPEYLGPVIDLFVKSIQRTFLYGLACAVAAALFTIMGE